MPCANSQFCPKNEKHALLTHFFASYSIADTERKFFCGPLIAAFLCMHPVPFLHGGTIMAADVRKKRIFRASGRSLHAPTFKYLARYYSNG